jgi:hypothetical protein
MDFGYRRVHITHIDPGRAAGQAYAGITTSMRNPSGVRRPFKVPR